MAVKPLLFEQGIKAAKRILLVELICLKHKGKATSEIDTKTELGKITTPTDSNIFTRVFFYHIICTVKNAFTFATCD